MTIEKKSKKELKKTEKKVIKKVITLIEVQRKKEAKKRDLIHSKIVDKLNEIIVLMNENLKLGKSYPIIICGYQKKKLRAIVSGGIKDRFAMMKTINNQNTQDLFKAMMEAEKYFKNREKVSKKKK